MQWNARSILLSALAVGVLGCVQSESNGPHPVIFELSAELATLTASQQALAAELAAAEEALGRLEAEKATRTELDELASMRRPWTVSIPLESAHLEGAGALYSPMVGVVFREVGFSRLHVGFTLPDDYVEGTDIELRVTWTKDRFLTSPCNFGLISNGAASARPGQRKIFLEDRFRGDAEPWNSQAIFPAPSDHEEVQALVVDIPGRAVIGTALKAGDHLIYRFFRAPAEPEDTCTGANATMVFLGMSAHPRLDGSGR